jgi:homogentisate 1,2-dioxygenase
VNQNSGLLTQGLKPSVSNPSNPGSHSAPGTPARLEVGSAYGAGRHENEKPWPYKQDQEKADQTFDRIQRMPWKTEVDDPAYRPTAKAEKAAGFHWLKLLRSGISASRIERAAEKFIAEWPENQLPCLAGFLGLYAQQCIDPEEWLYIPEDDE